MLRINRSASCPDPQTLGLHVAPPRPLPQPPSPVLSLPSPPSPLSPEPPPPAGRSPLPRRRRRGSVLSRLMKKGRSPGGKRNEEGEGGWEAELHLYSVSPTSRIYLHLQSSWSSYIIVRTGSYVSLSLSPHPSPSLSPILFLSLCSGRNVVSLVLSRSVVLPFVCVLVEDIYNGVRVSVNVSRVCVLFSEINIAARPSVQKTM